MRSFALTVCFPGSSPLVGGAAITPSGFHASHAQLPDGRPYIPSTALRGALRESLEALLRGTGEHRACAGGTGVDPEGTDPGPDGVRPDDGIGPAEDLDRTCSLGSDDAPCIACRMFGTGRRMLGAAERVFSALVIGDALPTSAFQWTARPSVAVTRSHRSAADKQLVFRRIPDSTGRDPLTFTARGRVHDAALERYLEAAARATTHLGAGRSRGFARVDISVRWRNETPAVRDRSTPPGDQDLRLRVTLTSPALIGASIVDANHRESRHEIPGAALRGAVGFALRALVEDADRDTATQDLLHAERGARFGFLYPADTVAGAGTDRVAGPLPITAAWCKVARRDHGVVDTLLDQLVQLHATSAAEAERAAAHAVSACKKCGEPLRTPRGSRLASSSVATRTVVRLAMDRARQSARDGQLHSQVLLAPGTVLEGTIRGIPPHSRQRLAEALGSGILSFGRGRSAGWGQAHVAVEPASELRPIAKRAEAFDSALRARLHAAGLSSAHIGRLVPVTLLSPLWPSGGDRDAADTDDDGERDLRAALGAAGHFLAARRFARDGAWDQRNGEMTTFRATVAGGVFVLELERATWLEVIDRLKALERDGIGQRRDQGFGQLLCFDPHFLLTAQNG
jgi:hypothetical protein